MKICITLLLVFLQGLLWAQDTLPGFGSKLLGEDITYFSTRYQFAKTALLTRCTGDMAISWEAPVYSGKAEKVTYKLLIGHSSGTSGADRHFDIELNGHALPTMTTPQKKTGYYTLQGYNEESSFQFVQEAYDANNDAFGVLYLTVPTSWIGEWARFSITGRSENSRDWLMVFDYGFQLQTEVKSTNLITRKELARKLAVFVDNPFGDNTLLEVRSRYFKYKRLLKAGYNSLEFPGYDENFTGSDELLLTINGRAIKHQIEVLPIRNYAFHIIHHSHNDIGYSHLQTEVEQIQSNNIRAAINWMQQDPAGGQKAIWHIESLWAVENFLRTATANDKELFKEAVQKGHIVLSANYANNLTGLCLDRELDWLLAYAKKLEITYGPIPAAMITDIPGITASGLRAYVRNGVRWLSLGPNFVPHYPDQGDRVGGVIREQGDEAFYWKNHPDDTAKLLVWTAGKGYSWFHNIGESDKQEKWEERLSLYLEELYASGHPYELIQLRYTKKADNGPVDTSLCRFVEKWNLKYKMPQLQISSLPELFTAFENRYGASLSTRHGEISPYWEDGAYSTASEEIQNRKLVQQTIALEDFARQKGKYQSLETSFYALQRNLVLFHEHTWGSWCSISDPDIPFSTEQWTYKKAFLDSAQAQYIRLAATLNFVHQPNIPMLPNALPITDFTIDPNNGGLSAVMVNGQNIVGKGTYRFCEPVYAKGINPMQLERASVYQLGTRYETRKTIEQSVRIILIGTDEFYIHYQLNRRTGVLTCKVSFRKLKQRRKESLHLALPLNLTDPHVSYVSGTDTIRLPEDQLPGSNYEFICTENTLLLHDKDYRIQLYSPEFNLFETAGMVDENTTNSLRHWPGQPGQKHELFLYLLNNYWHTNYKADQEGMISFEVQLQVGQH